MNSEDDVAFMDDSVGGIDMIFDDDFMTGGASSSRQEDLWKIH